MDEWQKACTKYNKNYEEVDISGAISACLAEKDEEEIVSSILVCFFYYGDTDGLRSDILKPQLK
jgi:hypothetical protein